MSISSQDVIVVPAHVMMSMASQATERAIPGVASTVSGQVAPTRTRKNPSELPDLAEETPSTPGTKDEDAGMTNRSRASTESPAFGMGSSQYV